MADTAEPSRRRLPRHLDNAFYFIRSNPPTAFGFALAVLLVMLAVFGPALSPYDPATVDPASRLQGPSAAHWMGTDNYGRDILSRVLTATRLDLLIAFVSVGIAFSIGIVLGSVAGFYGGLLDNATMRIMDILQSFPPFILAIGLAAALGGGVLNVIYVVAIIQIPVYTRFVRADMLSAKSRPYVDAARCAGCRDWQVVVSHILPNTLPPILVQVSVNMSWAILNAAGLSFIGLGVKPPTPEWGVMIREGAEFMTSGHWWIALFPGLAIVITIFCFNLVADGLRDILDPRLRH